MMRKRLGLTLSVLVLLWVGSSISAQQPRSRPASSNRANADIKIKYRSTVAGQTSESTSMIKGARERSESRSPFGGDSVTITQCDLKRLIQINESTRKYLITPMQVEAEEASAQSAPVTNPSPDTRRGGVVTYTSTALDTGERKELFGFTARRIKTSLSIESSPDACNPTKQRMETDGWYIDFSADFHCDLGRTQMAQYSGSPGGCRDQTRFRRQGTARTGYPLSETVTMYGPDGTVMFTSTKETVELSREPLAAALFEIPEGYIAVQSSQELYGAPSAESIASMMKGETAAPAEATPGPSITMQKGGKVRVGVVPLNNKTDKKVSTEMLRQQLISEILGAGIDAVPLNAEFQAAAEAEARAKECDYILFTDISMLKTAKLGGMFGRVAGVGGLAKSDSRLDFKLFAVGESTPRLQSTANAKAEGDEASAAAAIDIEARAVTVEVKKKSGN